MENLSESPPPSRWKPGQKPWKPKNMFPASNSLTGNENKQSLNLSALSALSAQRSKEDCYQKSQSQRSSEVDRSSLTDGHSRSHDKSKGLRVRGHRRNSYISEGSSRSSSSDRSVSKSRSYNRTESKRSKSRSDRSKNRSDRSKNRNDRSKSRSDRSKTRSDWSLYNSKVKNTKTIDRSYGSRSGTDSGSGDSMSKAGSQKSHTSSRRSRSTSSKTSKSKSTSCRSSSSASGSSRKNDGISSRNNRKRKCIEREEHQISKISSAPNAKSSQESKAGHNTSVCSRRDSGAYDKLAAFKLDTVKAAKKEKVDKRKKVSQVQWEPPVEPEYILVDTEDEDSKLDDPNQVSIRKNKKQSKKAGDATEAEYDKTEISVEQIVQEKKGSEEERTSENNAVEHTIAEVLEEENGQPRDEEFVEPCKVAVASGTRLDLSDVLEKQSLKPEMDIAINTKSQSVTVEADDQVLDAKVENQSTVAITENQVADVKAEYEVADVTAISEGAEVNIMRTVTEVNAGNQTVNANLQNEVADVIGEHQVAAVKTENQMVLDVKPENQMISDVNVVSQTDDTSLQSGSKDDKSTKSHGVRSIGNMMGENATSQYSVWETKNKSSDAVNAEDSTLQKASEFCSSIFSTAADIREVSESDLEIELASASVVESAPVSQITSRQLQSRSGPSKLPKLNLQDNRLLGKQLNFMWKSRSRLPVAGSAGVVRLNSPGSPRAPVLSSTISPDKLGHFRNVVEKSPVLAEDLSAQQDKEQQDFPKQSTEKIAEKVGRSWLAPSESLQSPSVKRSRSVSSDDSSSSSSSQSSRASVSSNSSAELERSPSARSISGKRYSNSRSQSSSKESDRWSKASDSRSPSFRSERRRSTVSTHGKNRTRGRTRSRSRSRARRRTRSTTRSVSRRIHRRSRSRRSRKRRSYSNRSSRSPTRRSFRSRSRRSRSRSDSRTPGSRLGRGRTRSVSRRSRTISRRRSYSRRTSGSSDYESWSRSSSRSRSYGRRSPSSSQDSYRKRRYT